MAGDIAAFLDAARAQLEQRDALGAFKTLEQARELAKKQKSLVGLRAVQQLAQEASARFASSGRREARAANDLLYSVKQNLAHLEYQDAARSGATHPEISFSPTAEAVPGEPVAAARTPPPATSKAGLGKAAIFAVASVLFLVAVIAIGVAGSHSSKKNAASSVVSTYAPPAAAVDKTLQHARAWIGDHGLDAQRVYASVSDVQLAVGLFEKSPTIDNANQLAQIAQSAHDNINEIRADFADTDSEDVLNDAELEAFSGANDLKNAMGALVAYTGDPNPATLAHFTSQYGQAAAEWNDGVRTIWELAHRAKPPTV